MTKIIKLGGANMKIVYLTNVLNHYQLALSDSFNNLPDVEYHFVATTPIAPERIALKIQDYNHTADYAICAMDGSEQEKEAFQAFMDADIGIVGMTPKQYKYIYQSRLKKNKLTFWASERVYKVEPGQFEMPLRRILYLFRHSLYRSKYMLCASAFTAGDYARTGNFIGKTYKWGYFPDFIQYDIDELMEKKSNPRVKIVWTGRYLNWKHPESMLYLGEYLKARKYDFEIEMIGTGEIFDEIRQDVYKKKLDDCVHVIGSLSPKEVRKHMEEANIYAFTSDRGEGWGVVLNEAMNSGCAVIGSHAIGSVPYLIRDGENGLVFESENWDDLCRKVESLFQDSSLMSVYGKAAYLTIRDTWNPNVAAQRLKKLGECLLNRKETPYEEGPCSKAEPMCDDWYFKKSERKTSK